MGTRFGVGATHLCILLGTYFSHSRGKVALVEWKNQEAFSNIQEAYDGISAAELNVRITNGSRTEINNYMRSNKKEWEEPPFYIKKAAYYKRFNHPSLAPLKDGKYQFIVVDFGEYADSHMSAFNEMDIKMIVGHTNEWKYKEIEGLIAKYPKSIHQQWKLILPFASKDEVKVLSRTLTHKMFPLSFIKDPFIFEEKISKEIDYILQG